MHEKRNKKPNRIFGVSVDIFDRNGRLGDDPMTEKAQGKLTPDAQASGSMLASLLGKNVYQTPNDCLVKGFAAIDNGGKSAPGDWQYIEAADWGNKSENLILEEMAERLGVEGDFNITKPFQHPTLPLAVSLDGIAEGTGEVIKTNYDAGIYVLGADEIALNGPGILEAKLTSAAPTEFPKPYRGPIQVEGCMMCTGYTWAAIGTLYRGTELRIYVVEVDMALRAKITADVLDFQKRIDGYKNFGDKDWYPALTPNDAANTWQQADDGDPPIKLSDELSQLALEYEDAMTASRAIAKLKQEITTQIMNALGNSTEGYVYEDGKQIGKVTWGTNKPRNGYVVKPRAAARAKSIKVEIND